MQAVIKFLPILESINPEDLERVTKPSQDPQATPEGQRAAVNFPFADHSSRIVGPAVQLCSGERRNLRRHMHEVPVAGRYPA